MEHQAATNISRSSAITRLRSALVALTDDGNSICKVAAERGLFCRGFRRYSDEELRNRYGWIARRHPAASRAELEDLANRWQLARQVFDGTQLACDAQSEEHDTCNGWDDFSNQELSGFMLEILGEEVAVW
jgi:hypothetical protein